MIIFGTGSKALKGTKQIEMTCESCLQQEHVAAGVIKYFHLFWIPAFVYSKKVVVRCLHCKYTNDLKKSDRPDVSKGLFDFKYIWSSYFLLFTLLALIIVSLIGGTVTAILG